MFKRSAVKLVLLLQWISLMALSAMALQEAVREGRAFQEAVQILNLTEADRVLFLASSDIRFEIGTHGLALLSLDDPQERLASSGAKVDSAYNQVLEALEKTELVDRDRLVGDIRNAYRELQRRREVIHEAMAQPADQRSIAAIEPWRQAILNLARAFTNASVAAGNSLRMLDTTEAQLVLVRQSSYAIRDRYDKPCADFYYQPQIEKPLNRHTIAGWRQDVDAYLARWRDLDEHLHGTGAPQILLEDVAAGIERTTEIQQMMDDVLYGLDDSPNPAIPAADWSSMCTSAYGVILKMGRDALDLAVAHAQQKKRTALVLLVTAVIVLVAVLVLGCVSVLTVRRRLSIPMMRLVEHIGRLARREYSEPIPRAPYPDELGAMAGALEGLRQGAREAEQLQQKLDRAREAEIEKASQASRAKSAFLATMSHEVRTPLNGILGMVQLLQASPLISQQRQWLEAISHSGTMLLAILNDILDYSKIEAGRLELEDIVFDLRELVQGVVASVLPQADARKIQFRSDLSCDLPVLVRGDPAKLSQILLNLVGNALKFTPKGEVRLSVRSLQPVPRPDWVRLEFQVSDTGIGIAPSALNHLFEAFAQSDTSITRRFGGTGLGLAICRRIIDAMGGTIAVRSQVGKGSEFTVTLDYAEIRDVRRTRTEPAETDPIPRLAVLLAEDNEVNAMVASGMLEQMGHAVTVAADGEIAADLAANNDYDLVMMDLAMPHLDGISAARRVRALAHPTRSQVPIIAVTANVSQTGVADCYAAGMNGFVGKPFRQHELVRAIADVIGAAIDNCESSAPEAASDPGALLAELVHDLGAARVERIIETFAGTTPALIVELELAFARGDHAQARDCAHRLKSAAGNVGLRQLAELAARAERVAEDGAAVQLGAMLREIAERVPQDIQALRTSWARLSPPVRQTDSRPHAR